MHNFSQSQQIQQDLTSNSKSARIQTLIAIFALITLVGCSNEQPKESDKKASPFTITAIDAEFPLRLNEVDFEDENNTIHLNDGIVSNIETTIKEYAKGIDFYDNSQTYRDTYFNTIRLHDSLQTIFLVLLKHYPTEELTSKVLFYDNLKKEFIDNVPDFKLYGLYDFDNRKLVPTNLKTAFKITNPEIEVLDINKDGINDFKFVRLWHNGTFNAIHTTILTIKNNSIDTISFEKTPIYIEE